MQTFMPMIGFKASLESLDDARLNKQVLEVSQIIDTILDESRGYQNHPAVTMWRDFPLTLCNFGAIAANVWSDRKGTALGRLSWFAVRSQFIQKDCPREWQADLARTPPWVGDLWFHRSHRSNLIRKDPMFYDWEGTPVNMPYLWPVMLGDEEYRLKLSAADVKRLETGERVLPEELSVYGEGWVREDAESHAQV